MSSGQEVDSLVVFGLVVFRVIQPARTDPRPRRHRPLSPCLFLIPRCVYMVNGVRRRYTQCPHGEERDSCKGTDFIAPRVAPGVTWFYFVYNFISIGHVWHLMWNTT
ncbi:hypothetical protein NHX12_014484 [Muraenolepis orangiensis]|uniref:Uncharacterized protein n=1 Tax=Muraenolepis orangiensis TaxID=630683 RepID=A0A9Q0DDN1_9TELE|nr:hypothetical protein NHX12_014484 [Muraenolepis orangiensis]